MGTIVVITMTITSLTLMLGSIRSARGALQGDVSRAWDTPYDLLVRPAASRISLETTDDLVRPNFMSGLKGGITESQLAAVRAIPGVDVAAPVAVVGFINWPSALQLPIQVEPSDPRSRLIRVSASATADGGLSRLDIETRLIVIAPEGRLSIDDRTMSIGSESVGCRYPVNCFAGTVCAGPDCGAGRFPSIDDARYYLPLLQPIVIAGIDPQGEARLAGLDGCLTNGRYLRPTDTPVSIGSADEEQMERIPVLVSDRSFVDEEIVVRIEEARYPVALETALASPDMGSWRVLSTTKTSAAALYTAYLGSIQDYVDYWPIWSAGEVSYSANSIEPNRLATATMEPDLDVYRKASSYVEFDVADPLLVPPEAKDGWFREVVEHADVPVPRPGSPYRPKIWDAVGRYDPGCLRGFDPLAGGALETYSFPKVERASDGLMLGPTRSMGGYVNSPPLLLTTLPGARWLSDPARYAGQPGDSYISIIRVRLADLGAPGSVAERRLAEAAIAIRSTTGLDVDIVKGASPESVEVDLPAGRFGRPAMTVRELWSRKGVVIVFEKAGRDEEVLLSIASLAAAVAFVGLTTLVAARRGRSEISVLHSLGWPAPHLWALIDGEVALMGAIATAAAAVVTTTVATFWKVSLEAGLVMPGLIVGGFMAPIAAAIPALAAARDSAQRTDGRLRTVRGSQVPGSLAALALRDLIDRPIPMSLGVGAICVSSITLGTLVLVATAFNGSLDATVLGAHLRAQVEPYHLALAVGGLVIATAAAGQVVALGYVDRIPEFATLRALGWPRSAIGRILMTQIAGMWALAATISTTALAGFGLAMAVFPEGTALAVGASLGASAIAAGLAVLPTILEVFRTSPARVLRGQ